METLGECLGQAIGEGTGHDRRVVVMGRLERTNLIGAMVTGIKVRPCRKEA